MEELSNAISFIINKKLSIVLDLIAEDYKIERDELDKYLSVDIKEEVIVKQKETTEPEVSVCQGKTKKGDACTNKPKPGLQFCGKHTP